MIFPVLAVEVLLALGVYLAARWRGQRPRAILILLLLIAVAPPLFGAVWARTFQVEPISVMALPRPAWIAETLKYAFYASVFVSLAVPLLAKGYRIPAAAFSLCQIPLTYFVWFVGFMTVTGNWI
jgi:hypothetical protein